jgi:hypothetical protein
MDNMDIPNMPPGLSPAERFAFVMRGLFRIPKAELDAQLAKSAAEAPKRTSGARPGTPNWRTKRKQASEKPTQ